LEKFQVAVAVVEHVGGLVGEDPGVFQFFADKLGVVVADLTPAQRAMASDTMLAMMFLGGADPNRSKQRLENLEVMYLEGQNNYPGTLADAYKLLSNWPTQSPRDCGGSNDGVAFVNDAEDTHGVSLTTQDQKPPGRNFSHITCHSCGKQGHYAPQCPDRKAKAANPIKMESNSCWMVLTTWNSQMTGFNSCKSLSSVAQI
jgi:hypothetical protein